jgi:hypothetical protein
VSSEASRRHARGYGRAARAYKRILDPMLEQVARRIVGLADVAGRDRVLDLASGTGAVARAAFARGAEGPSIIRAKFLKGLRGGTRTALVSPEY